MKTVLTVDEAAFLLGFHPEVIRRMARSKQLKSFGRPHRLPVPQFLSMGFTQEFISAALQSREPEQQPQVSSTNLVVLGGKDREGYPVGAAESLSS